MDDISKTQEEWKDMYKRQYGTITCLKCSDTDVCIKYVSHEDRICYICSKCKYKLMKPKHITSDYFKLQEENSKLKSEIECLKNIIWEIETDKK